MKDFYHLFVTVKRCCFMGVWHINTLPPWEHTYITCHHDSGTMICIYRRLMPPVELLTTATRVLKYPTAKWNKQIRAVWCFLNRCKFWKVNGQGFFSLDIAGIPHHPGSEGDGFPLTIGGCCVRQGALCLAWWAWPWQAQAASPPPPPPRRW